MGASRRAIPSQRTAGSTWCPWEKPADDDPDRRPLMAWCDPQPRPLRRTHPRGWTDGAKARLQAQLAQSLLVFALLRVERRSRDELLARIGELESEVATLRLRADLGHELAVKVDEVARLRTLLLADDEHADAATGEIAVVREARAS